MKYYVSARTRAMHKHPPHTPRTRAIQKIFKPQIPLNLQRLNPETTTPAATDLPMALHEFHLLLEHPGTTTPAATDLPMALHEFYLLLEHSHLVDLSLNTFDPLLELGHPLLQRLLRR